MAIKVNFATMQSQINAARDSYDNLIEKLNAANRAQAAAVSAAGGTTTPVGNAINNVLGETMASRLSEAKLLIDTLSTQIEKYKTAYTTANDDLLAFIGTLNADDGSGAGANNASIGSNAS